MHIPRQRRSVLYQPAKVCLRLWIRKTLFEKYGGFSTIRQVVQSFYNEVLDHEVLSPYFDGVDMARLIDHQSRFFASAMSGPSSFLRTGGTRQPLPLHSQYSGY
ncbi:MAG TPA: hypothetical protein EYP93_01785 [Gammaproteobacteria bacterium]|nr:hypothetical protein [Gammaproteobacteria bacterium]